MIIRSCLVWLLSMLLRSTSGLVDGNKHAVHRHLLPGLLQHRNRPPEVIAVGEASPMRGIPNALGELSKLKREHKTILMFNRSASNDTSLLELGRHKILPLLIPLIPAVAAGIGTFALGKFTHEKVMDSKMPAYGMDSCLALFNGSIANLDADENERTRVSCGLYMFERLTKLEKDASTEGGLINESDRNYTIGWEALRPFSDKLDNLDMLVDPEKKYNGLRKRRRDLGFGIQDLRRNLETRFGVSFDSLSRLEENIRDALMEDKQAESKISREAATKFQRDLEKDAAKMVANSYSADATADAALRATEQSVEMQQRNLLRNARKGNKVVTRNEGKFGEMNADLYRRLLNNEDEASDIVNQTERRNKELAQKLTVDAESRFRKTEESIGREILKNGDTEDRETAGEARDFERRLNAFSKKTAMTNTMQDRQLDRDLGGVQKKLAITDKNYKYRLGEALNSLRRDLYISKASTPMRALQMEKKIQERSMQRILNDYHSDVGLTQKELEQLNSVLDADAASHEKRIKNAQSDIQRELFTNINHLQSILSNAAVAHGADAHRLSELMRDMVSEHQTATERERVRAGEEIGEGESLVAATANELGGRVANSAAQMKLKIDRVLASRKAQLSDGTVFISESGRRELLKQKQIYSQFSAEERALLLTADNDVEGLSREDQNRFIALAAMLGSESSALSKDFGIIGTALSGLSRGVASEKAELQALESAEGSMSSMMDRFSKAGVNAIEEDNRYGMGQINGLRSKQAVYTADATGVLNSIANEEEKSAANSVDSYLTSIGRQFGAERNAILTEESQTRAMYDTEKADVDKMEESIGMLRDESQQDEAKLRDALLHVIRSDDEGAEKFIQELMQSEDGRMLSVRNLLLKMIGTDAGGVMNATEADAGTIKDKLELLLATEETQRQKDVRRDMQMMSNTQRFQLEKESHRQALGTLRELVQSLTHVVARDLYDREKQIENAELTRGLEIKKAKEELTDELRKLDEFYKRMNGGVYSEYIRKSESLKALVNAVRKMMGLDAAKEAESRQAELDALMRQYAKIKVIANDSSSTLEEKQQEEDVRLIDRTKGASDTLTDIVYMIRSLGSTGEELTGEAQGDLNGVINSESEDVGKIKGTLNNDVDKIRDELGGTKVELDDAVLAHRADVAKKDSSLAEKLDGGGIALGAQANRLGNVLGYNSEAARRYQQAVNAEKVISGDELKALAHRVSAYDDSLLDSIARSKGLALNKAASMQTVMFSFLEFMSAYFRETKRMVDIMRLNMASLDPIAGPIANKATEMSQEVQERASEVAREVSSDLEGSKVLHTAMYRDLDSSLKAMEKDFGKPAEEEILKDMAASSKTIDDTRDGARESFDQWLRGREHHYDSVFVGLASELNQNGEDDED